jgi:hypothetical protein
MDRSFLGFPLSNRDNYLSIGELKGGIDPAGADEHWKKSTNPNRRTYLEMMGGFDYLRYANAIDINLYISISLS